MESFGPARKIVPDVDELLKSTPLFMNQLSDADPDNDTLTAIQSLIYDGTPEEMAGNFKDQGNEAFQSGNKKLYPSAIEHYSKGIAAKANDPLLNSILYSNRAAVNLELENYRKVLNDCKEAIKLNPQNVKAFYRSAKALLFLERIYEARDCCKLGLQLEPQNKALLDLRKKVEDKNSALEKAKLASENRARVAKEKEKRLWITIKSRGVTTVNTLIDDTTKLTHEAFLHTHKPTLNESTNELTYPVLFLYPEHTLSDIISEFNEHDSLSDHIALMFGPENRPLWDAANNAYKPENIEVYFETRPDLDAAARGLDYKEIRDGKRKLMKVDAECSLADILATEGFRLVDGVANFFLLSKASAQFAKTFRKQYR
ncbi:hypothetical protein HK100_001012 [Physocladia obscura]|uniref:Cns1/TTC4 wheel domain-containing protein n=1 Tax=Physocladia obscura TaxID=109957 RepID=A0AAD5XC47_9FUNG|nr:hypothetical protein HK100_001012 [Physocladia obscura]